MEGCGGYFLNQVMQVNIINNGTNWLVDLMHWEHHFSDVSAKYTQCASKHEEIYKPKLRDILLNN